MKVKQLIEILLDKCSLDADVFIVDENGEFLNQVEFIEFDSTNDSVLLWDSEPNWEECHEEIEVQMLERKSIFAKTTYREI